jgi:serpin B
MRAWLIALALVLLAATPQSFPEARLAVDLSGRLGTNQNLCLAPHSLVNALTMAGHGATGPTRTEFERLLGSLDGASALARDKQLPLVSANRLWVASDFPIVPAYADYCDRYFGAQPAAVDFEKNPKKTAETINSWVKQQTADRISQLIEPDMLDRNTRLMLTNATTLKAKWAAPFDPQRTRPAAFLALDGSTTEVPMMSRSGNYPYLEEGDLQVLEMPYVESGLSLIVALPAVGQLPALEGKMTAETLPRWLEQLASVKPIPFDPEFSDPNAIQLSFPKIEVRSDRLKLKQPLIGAGLKLAFSPKSDFSGLSSEGKDLYIDDVVQATMIRFNEEGTEAAAATAVEVSVRDMPQRVFRVDHPFLFFLVHRPTSTVLFSGRVVSAR